MVSRARLWLGCLLAVAPGALRAGEMVVELKDGRVLTGTLREAAQGEPAALRIETSGGAAAWIPLPPEQVAAMKPAPARAIELKTSQPEEAKVARQEVLVELRKVLAQVLAVAASEMRASKVQTKPREESPLPNTFDPLYELRYGPLKEGVFAENFKGLLYYQGVLPGYARRAAPAGGWVVTWPYQPVYYYWTTPCWQYPVWIPW